MLEKLQVLDTEVVKSKMGVCEVKMRRIFLFEDGNECFRKLGAMFSDTQSNAFEGQEHSFGPPKAMFQTAKSNALDDREQCSGS